MKSRDTGAGASQGQPAAVRKYESARGVHEWAAVGHSAIQRAIDRSPRIAAQRRALQAAFGAAFQRQTDGLENEAPRQARTARVAQREPIGDEHGSFSQGQFAPTNETGMPDHIKAGVESLSGMDLSDVRIHRNSNKPAELNALAYAQGNHIHLGPGQEQHLPHEAWHVVQQRQGRVRETLQMAGVGVNDDAGLEREAG